MLSALKLLMLSNVRKYEGAFNYNDLFLDKLF